MLFTHAGARRAGGTQQRAAEVQAVAQLLRQHNQILVCSYVLRTAGSTSRRSCERQLNESPQAHEPVALGLSMVKPCFSMVSTKSMVAPWTYGALIRSTVSVDAAEVGGQVAVERPVVEEEVVAQAGAAARLDRDAQRQVVAALLVQQCLRLGCRGVGQDHAVGAWLVGRLVLNSHCFSL